MGLKDGILCDIMCHLTNTTFNHVNCLLIVGITNVALHIGMTGEGTVGLIRQA